jgi:Ca-activated chloride channel family protein
MMAEDMKPNRLEAWKKVLVDFIDSIKLDRIWIILFSWKPFNSIPLTFDYKFLKDFMKDITVDTINQSYNHLKWTAIWDAIILAIDSFKKSENREKVIILITDGEANRWLDPMIALKLAKKENIKIYTIWIWWLEDTYIEMVVWFFPQKVKIWWVDEGTLKKVAYETWWKYFRATSEKKLSEIFEDISKLEKKNIEINKIKTNKEKNIILVYLLIFFMLILFFLKYKKRI